MAELHELIQKIENPELRKQIQDAANRLTKQKKFGLVFEEHLPECTPLYDIPVRKGSKVSLRAGKVNETYTVLKIESGKAVCLAKNSKDTVEFDVAELVVTAEFGEPIYPYLKPIDSVCNAPDSDLWHTLIEADNYHALQLLEYLYAGKVDCIYIDPPYNTGARDWKYNNDYVDGSDSYRHSKWLSFVQKRLNIAKKLLNPANSVLIVTIDEKEYLHLGCLLEEMFPEANIQMITNVISRNGTSRENEFSRVEEYLFICRFGDMGVTRTNDNMLSADGEGIISRVWFNFMRTSTPRSKTKGQFFPIYINPHNRQIVEVGEALLPNENAHDAPVKDGLIAVFPIKDDGSEATWGAIPNTTRELLNQGYLRVGTFEKKTGRWNIQYVREGDRERISKGEILVEGKADDGSLILKTVDARNRIVFPKTVWNRKSHDATEHGTRLLKQILPGLIFPYPKSLYAVHDTLKFFVANNPNALIVDFFAGSGTTLHAVNLLNAEDGGFRRCIMVTNNEVSNDDAVVLNKKGFKPGDEEWERLGIARHITWPRTLCSIHGYDVNGKPLKGDYGILEEEFVLDEDSIILSKSTSKPTSKKVYIKKKIQKAPLLANINKSDGFLTNVNFFKLGFLDKTKVSLGMQFKELLSLLWMKAGSSGKCPAIDGEIPKMLVLPENKMAILNDENYFGEFIEEVTKHEEIEVVYLVTDYEDSFVSMSQALSDKTTYQLYRDYLDNFRINAGRNAR